MDSDLREDLADYGITLEDIGTTEEGLEQLRVKSHKRGYYSP